MKVYSPKFIGKPFPFYLRRSTYVHIALVLLTVSGSKMAFEVAQKERDKNLELVNASVRVDMVAMPSHTLNELKNMSSGVEEAKKEEPAKEEVKAEPVVEKVEEKIVEKAETKEDPVPSLEEVNQNKRQDFLSKLKKIASKRVDSEGRQNTDKGLYGEKSTDLKNLVLSGNKLKVGSQMYGDGNSANLTAFQAYAARMPMMIKPHWRLPSYLLEKSLKCRVRVWLNMSGEVTRTAIYQSSGDAEYDQRAIESIKSASPFPALTEDFGRKVQDGDIVLGFPL